MLNKYEKDNAVNTEFESDLNQSAEPVRVKKKKKKKKFLLGSFVQTLVCVAVCAAIACVYTFANYLGVVTVEVTARFTSIANSVNPDGTRFEIMEILNDEVLAKASEKLGGRVSPEYLRRHIIIRDSISQSVFGNVEQNILDGNESYAYIPSVYAISYSTTPKTSSGLGFFGSIKSDVSKLFSGYGASDILNAVTESYSEYFAEHHAPKNTVLNVDREKIESLDYYDAAKYLASRVSDFREYINKYYYENKEFVSETTKKSFGDINTMLSVYSDTTLDTYKSYIIEQGITNDIQKLNAQFQYIVSSAASKKVRNEREYEVRLRGISIYDQDVTKVVFVPSIDSDENFYMSRTRIGIDYLTEDAYNNRVMANTQQQIIDDNNYLISCFANRHNTDPAAVSNADNLKAEAIDELEKISEIAIATDQDYNTSFDHDNFRFAYTGYGVGKRAIILDFFGSFVFCLFIIFVVDFLLSIYFKKIYKKSKGSKKVK